MELENFKNSLKRLKKCDMYWDEMQPNEIGRLCQRCNKTIIDFSKMSFTDIAFKMAETNESTCGFYLPEQLAKIKQSKKNIPLSVGLTTLMATTSLANSENKENKEIEKYCLNKVYNDKEKNEECTEQVKIGHDSILISGKVEYYDSIAKKNLTDAYAYIIIKGTKTGTVTNENGDFQMKYLPGLENEKIILSIGAIGFEQKEIEISTESKSTDLGVIVLVGREAKLTEFIVTRKRISFAGRIWRKITKPFR
ncbi:carboxypeptidase-like regulatory domain-containing protein [Flavobacterium sp. WG21]|uniref:carboxypeptidase-like regulatory domain-containing protein n=1 Tax=Flavobacterium sp. WG21 TaxID=1229487 RepID=UPI00034519C8|nr:carboxypeptidase-like regulatory domain-containing protein [Flavobacterium sp. WG21]